MSVKFFIFAILINVAHAKETFSATKLPSNCNLPHGYVDKSFGRDFIYMKLIPLSKRSKNPEVIGKYFAIVDDKDYDILNKFNWTASINSHTVYAHRGIGINGKRAVVAMHRCIIGVTDPKIEVDHIDGNGLNCQRENLRICTRVENMRNSSRKKGSSSQYKGVHRSYTSTNGNRTNFSWRAAICKKSGKVTYLGCFENELDAALAYDKAAKKHFGRFAKLNFHQ